jgi:hypothetical protein
MTILLLIFIPFCIGSYLLGIEVGIRKQKRVETKAGLDFLERVENELLRVGKN